MLAVSPVVWGTDVGQAMGLAAMLRPSRGVGWLLAGHSLVQVVWVMAVVPNGVGHLYGRSP